MNKEEWVALNIPKCAINSSIKMDQDIIESFLYFTKSLISYMFLLF